MKNRVPTFLSNNNTFSPGTLRLGLTFGMIIYGVFGYLDLYAMPSNYGSAYIIRYAIIFPLLIITFFLSYYQPFYRYSKTILFLLLSVGQIGIIAMIGISKPDDLAFSTYYAGLILIMLWAAYIFRVNFYITIYMAISTILLYNLTMLFKQYLLSFPYRSTDMAILLNNNFFLISSAVLISIGAHQFERILRENSEFNAEIISEKEQLKLAKEQTEKSEEKFRKLFENSPVGISMTGIDGALSVNTSFCNILGYSEDELRTIKWMDITHPEDINLTNQFIQSLADGKVPQVRFEKRYIHKNGHTIWTDHFSYMELEHSLRCVSAVRRPPTSPKTNMHRKNSKS